MAKFYAAEMPEEEKKAPVKKKPKFYPAEVEESDESYSDGILDSVASAVGREDGFKFGELAEETAETAIDAGLGAAQGLSYNYLDEIAGGVSELAGGDYKETRDKVRGAWSEARERSPIASFAGELGGAVVSPGSKILGAGKGLRGVLRGAVDGGAQAYGATEKENLKDQAMETGLGAGVGAGTGLVANAITSGFSKSPSAVRAEVMGTKGKNWRVDGPGDRQEMVERISKTGMFKNRKMEYDVDTMSFVPQGKSKFQIDDIEKNTEERLFKRAQDAINKLQKKKIKDFGMLLEGRFVPSSAIDNMAAEITAEYSKRGLLKGPFNRAEAVEQIRKNIYDQVANMGGDMSRFSLSELDQLKRMAQEDVRNFSKGLGELGDNDELARITARKLKNLVEDNIGGDSVKESFKKINSAQHDFLSAKGDLEDKLKSLELATPASANVNKTSLLEGGIDRAFGGSQGRLDRAATKEWYENVIPEPARAVIPYAAEEAPGVLYRQQMQGNEMKGNWRNPSSVPNIPEELIRTPLPRSTDGLMKNKKFVLAKVAQMAPEMLDGIQDVFENNPEELPQLAQVISMKMPHFFEKDKYNRFDGRILNEADKQKAIKDTLSKNELSSIDQAKIITRLNKEGLYDY